MQTVSLLFQLVMSIIFRKVHKVNLFSEFSIKQFVYTRKIAPIFLKHKNVEKSTILLLQNCAPFLA
ncbi:hypothetical protein C1N70_13725 [Cytobacillus firmus]